MKTAIMLITRIPNVEQIEYTRKMGGGGYDVYIAVDDNSKTYSGDGVHYIQYDTAECEKEGWKGSSPTVKPGAIAWDKALRFACASDYDRVWFMEDDVLVPNVSALRDIDAKYEEGDILSQDNRPDDGSSPWHWRWIRPHIAQPRAHSMICAVRLTRRVLDAVDEFRKAKGTLFFIESMFHSLALHKQYTIRVIPELAGIVYRRDWRKEEIKRGKLYHPFKVWAKQKSSFMD
jgi:hypothetical protein